MLVLILLIFALVFFALSAFKVAEPLNFDGAGKAFVVAAAIAHLF